MAVKPLTLVALATWLCCLPTFCSASCMYDDASPWEHFKVKRKYWSFFPSYTVEADDNGTTGEVGTVKAGVSENLLLKFDGNMSAELDVRYKKGGFTYHVKDCAGFHVAEITQTDDPLDKHLKFEIKDATGAVQATISGAPKYKRIFSGEDVTANVASESTTFATFTQETSSFFLLFKDSDNEWLVTLTFPGATGADVASQHLPLDVRVLVFAAILQWDNPVFLGPFVLILISAVFLCCCCVMCMACCSCIRSSQRRIQAGPRNREEQPLLTEVPEEDREAPPIWQQIICCTRGAAPMQARTAGPAPRRA